MSGKPLEEMIWAKEGTVNTLAITIPLAVVEAASTEEDASGTYGCARCLLLETNSNSHRGPLLKASFMPYRVSSS